MKVKALFFDLDGTLVDTFEANFQAYKHALNDLGYPLTREQLRPTFGQRADIFLPVLYPTITPAEIEQIKQLKITHYPTHLHHVKPNQQLIDFLHTVRPSHITVLVTMAQMPSALIVLKAVGLTDSFDHIVSGDMVAKAKPDPESYLLALQKSGCLPAEVLVFEDSDSGLAAAEAAGLTTLAITMPELV